MKVILGICLVSLLTLQLARAAEINGEDLDGEAFSGKVFRSDTERYYQVDIMFEKNEGFIQGIIQFDNGQRFIGALDNEKIKDGTKFYVFDYYSGKSINFEIYGLQPLISNDDSTVIPAVI